MVSAVHAPRHQKTPAYGRIGVTVQSVHPGPPRTRPPRECRQALTSAPRTLWAWSAPRLRRSMSRDVKRSSLCSWSSRRRTLAPARGRRLRERVAKQEARIAELERRLNRNSRNSSLPPSQDPPGARLSAARLRPRGAGAVPSRATQATVVIWRRSRRSMSSSTTGPRAAPAATTSARRSVAPSASRRAIRSRSCRRSRSSSASTACIACAAPTVAP